MEEIMARKKRRTRTPEQKVAIIKQHLVDKVPISDLCDQHKLNPTLFYKWLKIFFENGAAAFRPAKPDSHARHLQDKVDKLEARLKEKNEVIAEVTQEFVSLKKELGEL